MNKPQVSLTITADTLEQALDAVSRGHPLVVGGEDDALTSGPIMGVLAGGMGMPAEGTAVSAADLLLALNTILEDKYEAVIRKRTTKARGTAAIELENGALAGAKLLSRDALLAMGVEQAPVASEPEPAPAPAEGAGVEADAAAADAAEPAAEAPAPAPSNGEDLDQMAVLQAAIDKLVTAYAHAQGRDKVTALLSKYGVRKFAELDPARAGELLADADEITKQLEAADAES